MAENTKRYYWLKLKDDFFDEKYIKALRKLPQGDSLAIVYLKMQLKSLKTEGIIKYEGIMPDAMTELALLLDEDENVVRLAVEALIRFGVVERWDNDTFYLVQLQQLIGSETQGAARVRKHRELKNSMQVVDETPKIEAKANAERQKAFRAKKACEGVQHIPFIEDNVNSKRYGGNYYIVMKRDKFKCAVCGNIENLCIHHIDGYDENKPENNAENKMIVLCRKCHSQVHAGVALPDDILQSIDYFDSNVTLPSNADVTTCNTEIEKEIEIRDRDKSIDIEDKKKEKKEKYGTFNNVLLTPTELDKLKNDYSNYLEAIDYLSEYIESTGKKYKSHYLSIKRWVFDALKEKALKQKELEQREARAVAMSNKPSAYSTSGNPFLDLARDEGIIGGGEF